MSCSPAPLPLVDENGAWDCDAIAYDALAGKLVAVTRLHELAVKYETTLAAKDVLLAAKDARIAELLSNPAAPPRPAPPPAASPPPPTNEADVGRGQKKGPEGEGRSSRFSRWRRAFSWLGMISALLGGPAALMQMFVGLLKGTFRGKKGWLGDDPISTICDDPILAAKFEKELSKRRCPRVAQFAFAKVERLTYAAMDRLRFAMPWCPGHGTLAKWFKKFEEGFTKNWVPNGPVAGVGGCTARTEQQQAEDAEMEDVAVEEEDDADVQREAEEAMREPDDSRPDTLESGADDVEREALALLATEFPKDSKEELMERWSQGAGEGVEEGARVVHVLARASDGALLGFVKAMAGPTEVFLDEVLVGEAARGQRLSAHLIGRLMAACKKVRFTRLMVSLAEEKAPARKVYKGLNYDAKKPRGASVWDEPEDPSKSVMMGATRAAVERGVAAMVKGKALGDGIRLEVCWAGERAEGGQGGEGGAEGREEAGREEAGRQEGARQEGAGEAAAREEREEREGRERDGDEAGGAAAGVAAGERVGEAHGCDEREMREDDGDDVVAADDRGQTHDPSHGANSLSDVLGLMLVCQWTGNVVLKGSVASRFGFKITCDAARLMNAPRAWQVVTTIIVQILAAGVKPGNWAGAVKYMVHLPQSCRRVFPIRTWFGKDSRKNLQAHLAPLMEEALRVETHGLRVDLPQTLPPWGRPDATGKHASWERDAQGRLRPTRPRETLRGTKAHAGVAPVREMLTTGVLFEPTVMFCFDGATTINGSGTSFKDGDLFTYTAQNEMNLLLGVVPIKKGEGFREVAERLCPGCSAPSHKFHWLIGFLAHLNAHAHNSELQSVTKEPERQPEPAQEASIGQQTKARQTSLFGAAASDSRTAKKLQPYKEEAVRRANYKHKEFIPTLNGADPLATAEEDGLIRTYITLKPFTRDLSRAIWAMAAEREITPRLALCVIHCGMRTLESSLRSLLVVMG